MSTGRIKKRTRVGKPAATPKQKDEMAAKRLAGRKLREIAADVGLGMQTVNAYVNGPEGLARMDEMLTVHNAEMAALVAKAFQRTGELLDAGGNNWQARNEGVKRVGDLLELYAKAQSHKLEEKAVADGRGTVRLDVAIGLVHQMRPEAFGQIIEAKGKREE